MITLDRAYMPDGSCTLGQLTMPDGWECFTLENPWRGNQRNVSCVHEGTYTLARRFSPIVQRITRGRHQSGWEVQNVANRSYIMIHPGNWVDNTDGCILVGRNLSANGTHGFMVTHSQETFDELMKRLDAQDAWTLRIRTKVPA